jgi:hypothetical protein
MGTHVSGDRFLALDGPVYARSGDCVVVGIGLVQAGFLLTRQDPALVLDLQMDQLTFTGSATTMNGCCGPRVSPPYESGGDNHENPGFSLPTGSVLPRQRRLPVRPGHQARLSQQRRIGTGPVPAVPQI